MAYEKKYHSESRSYGERKGSYRKEETYSYGKAQKDGDGYRKGGKYQKDGDGYRKGDKYQKDGDGYRKGDKHQDKYQKDGKKPYRREEKPFVPKEASVPNVQEDEQDAQPYLLIGRNAVREAIKAERSIDRILVSAEQDGSLREILNLARDQKLVIREVDRKKLDELCLPFGHGGRPANHQGIVAYAAGVSYCTVADILQVARERNEAPFVIVLDGIEDPHNLGSIIRSADCAGAHGVIIGKRRSASVTAAAVKASAGATEHVRIARVVNINGALQELKRAGLWIAGADMGGRSMREQGLNGPLALVIGSEGEGLAQLVRKNCDFLVSIPMQGHMDSLNAGVAAAILMFEKRRQDEQQ